MFQTLYRKCLNLASHKSSNFYLGLVSFIESSFFPIPPDVMIVPMVIAKKKKYIKNLGDKDSRKRIVSLTKEGVDILDKAIPLWMEAEEEIFEESKKYNFSIL